MRDRSERSPVDMESSLISLESVGIPPMYLPSPVWPGKEDLTALERVLMLRPACETCRAPPSSALDASPGSET